MSMRIRSGVMDADQILKEIIGHLPVKYWHAVYIRNNSPIVHNAMNFPAGYYWIGLHNIHIMKMRLTD